MKKKNLQLKLNLKKHTVTDLNAVTGGIQDAVKTQPEICVKATEGYASQCCPACRSGCNATMVKELCDVVVQSLAAREDNFCA